MYDDRMQEERMASEGPDRRLTYEDFLLFPDDGRRHELIDGEHCVTPSPNTRHQDLVGRLHLEILTDKNVQGAPALVIEILSPGTRETDEHAKRRLFERGGVREYWIVDPEIDQVNVFVRQADGSFPRTAELTREHTDVLSTELLPGLTIQLSEVFA